MPLKLPPFANESQDPSATSIAADGSRPPPFRKTNPVRQRVAIWGGTLLCLGWASHGLQMAGAGLETRSGEIKGADYIQFYLMGSLLEEGRGHLLYDTGEAAAEAKRQISPRLEHHPQRNPYGPQVALAFAPLATLPFLASLAVFSLLSLLAYVVAIWVPWRHAPGLRADARYVALAAAGFPALLVTLRFGQISTFTLLAVALAVPALAAGRSFAAGLCFGVLAYKPQLLVVVLPMALLARDWRFVAGMATMAATQLMIGWAAVGIHVMQLYVQTLVEITFHPDLVMIYPENSHSLRGFLRLLGAPPTAATAACLAAAIASAPVAARAWRADAPPLMRVSLVVLLTLLVTPHLLTYDLVLLALPIMWVADRAVTHPGRTGVPVVLATALYIASFSPVLARHTRLQLSTLAIAGGVCVASLGADRYRGISRLVGEARSTTPVVGS
jgi:hypothetical protein